MRRTVECGCNSSAELQVKGPTVDVSVGLQSPNAFSDYTALVDTGASRSCIDVSVAQDLGLPVIDQEQVIGVHGVAVVDIYLATLAIRDLRLHRFGRFAGARLIEAGLPYAAMVGRDFLADLSLCYCGRSGRVTLEAEVH